LRIDSLKKNKKRVKGDDIVWGVVPKGGVTCPVAKSKGRGGKYKA